MPINIRSHIQTKHETPQPVVFLQPFLTSSRNCIKTPPLLSSSSLSHQIMASSSSSSRFTSCFLSWITQQEGDLDELLRAIPNTTTSTQTDDDLRSLISKIMAHFEDYSASRRALVREDPPAFFCPDWCSTFENCFLWIGGCRPTLSIRLLYAQSGSKLEAHLQEFLAGGAEVGGSAGLIELTAQQMAQIEDLHQRTLKKEERMGLGMATLQEDVADNPLLMIARGVRGQLNQATTAAMDEYGEKLARMMEEADELRIRTARELVVDILTPRQAVELLAAGKQLHLSVHAWGQRRDRDRGEVGQG